MELVQLRKRGPLVEPFGDLALPRNGSSAPKKLNLLDTRAPESEPPRALKSLSSIIENELCHRCGSCVGICPTSVLGVDDDDYPVVKNLSACTDCDLCVKVCPGDDFDAPAAAKEIYGHVPDVHNVYGQFEQGYLIHATDQKLRLHDGTSGGFVTVLLTSLLERGIIDGAAVVAQDPVTKWKGVAKIARTPEELLDAAKSKYAITPTNQVFSEILDTPGKYALVGLPCQIHGLHKAGKLDKRLKERVVLTVGLICHAALEHDAVKVLWNGFSQEDKDFVRKFVYRDGKHPGTTFAFMKDGSRKAAMFPDAKKYRPDAIEMMNILYRLYTPSRCFTCYDSMVEFADISCGDPWMIPPRGIDFRDGYTFVIARNKKANLILQDTAATGLMKMVELSREQTQTSNYAMGTEKRKRAFRLLKSRRRAGLPVPDYGFEIPDQPFKHRVEVEANLLTHVFSFIKVGRDSFLRFLLTPVGYGLFYLNNRRRRLRYLIKKRITRMREAKAEAQVGTQEEEELRQW